jgi:hypothetical protein
MSAASEIRRDLQQIAAALGLPTAPGYLRCEQIAQVAKFAGIADIKNAHTLSASVERGVRMGDKRWLAYRSAIRKGAHRVPSTDVARWMAIAAGRIPMPPSAASGAPTSAGCASVPGHMWNGLVHRCEDR